MSQKHPYREVGDVSQRKKIDHKEGMGYKKSHLFDKMALQNDKSFFLLSIEVLIKKTKL